MHLLNQKLPDIDDVETMLQKHRFQTPESTKLMDQMIDDIIAKRAKFNFRTIGALIHSRLSFLNLFMLYD